MKTFNDKNQCRLLRNKRQGLTLAFKTRVLQRLNEHVAECPKCQKRLSMVNRVEVALMLMKSEPYKMGLLARANNKALDTLKHSLRFAPESTLLRQAKSDTNRIEKTRPFIEKALNIAACLFVFVMIKSGVSHSLLDYREQGENVIHNYYANNLDSQMLEDIFPTDSSTTG
jgi:hypothetical protein